MRKLLAAIMVAGAALVAGPAQSADIPYYPPIIEVPPVDDGLKGSFYLRGSLGGSLWWAKEVKYRECPGVCGVPDVAINSVTEAGYGYSFGAGFGYETGDGLRADFTVDHLSVKGLSDGVYDIDLRSTLALANVYYDLPLGGYGYGSAAGGFGVYVGAGLGAAYNHVSSSGPNPGPEGKTWSPAAAVMAGVSYDMGALVADLGYRGIYIPQITNGDAALEPPALSPYYIDNNFIHEVRGTLRYRFN